MTDSILLTGVVATIPRSIVTAEGLAVVSFRLASALRRFDRSASAWVDAGTNWYSVAAFRRLAENTAASVRKGDRVMVSGRVRIRDWESSGRNGTTVEVEAEAIGHDLNWGGSEFRRTPPTAGASVTSGTEGRATEQDDVEDLDQDCEDQAGGDQDGGRLAEPVPARGADGWAAPVSTPF